LLIPSDTNSCNTWCYQLSDDMHLGRDRPYHEAQASPSILSNFSVGVHVDCRFHEKPLPAAYFPVPEMRNKKHRNTPSRSQIHPAHEFIARSRSSATPCIPFAELHPEHHRQLPTPPHHAAGAKWIRHLHACLRPALEFTTSTCRTRTIFPRRRRETPILGI
jgi:hypothetical protein